MLQAGYSSRRQSGVNDPGKLDRVATIYVKSYSQLTSGEKIVTWSKVADVWTGRRPMRSSRFYADDTKNAETITIHRINYRTDVTTFMRLTVSGDAFEIIGVEEMGRQHFLDLTCRTLDKRVAAELATVPTGLVDSSGAGVTDSGNSGVVTS